MNSIYLQLVFVFLSIALSNGDVPKDEESNLNPNNDAPVLPRELHNDERSHGGQKNHGKKVEIASGNGIKGVNYGFFGSFNYDFKHKPHVHVPHTHPTTGTSHPTHSRTPVIDSNCPAWVSTSECVSNVICSHNAHCGFNQSCCPVNGDLSFTCCLQLGATPPITTDTSTTTTSTPTTTTPTTTPTTTYTTTEFIYDCPYWVDSSNCAYSSYQCKSGRECYSSEICCRPKNGNPPCCHSTYTPTPTYPTTYGGIYQSCPYYIDSSMCVNDVYPCESSYNCYYNSYCCKSNIFPLCCKSVDTSSSSIWGSTSTTS